jgi:hypothetical protein
MVAEVDAEGGRSGDKISRRKKSERKSERRGSEAKEEKKAKKVRKSLNRFGLEPKFFCFLLVYMC